MAKIRATAFMWLAFVCLSGVVRAQDQPARAAKFAEFGDHYQTYVIVILEEFAAQLQQQPNARGFLIVYRARRDLPGLSLRYAQGMKEYLSRRVSAPERLITMDGGVAQELVQELWIVPPGATPKIREEAYILHTA